MNENKKTAILYFYNENVIQIKKVICSIQMSLLYATLKSPKGSLENKWDSLIVSGLSEAIMEF